jgi:hypothetical protein
MFRAIKLKEGERILLVVRQTPIVFSGAVLLGLFLFLLPFFLLFPLFSYGKWGVAGFIILILVAFCFSSYKFVLWYFNCGIITNQRVIDIDQKNITDRVVSEVPYYKIDDVSYTVKGLKQTLFHYGNVIVAIRGYRSSVTLQNVAHPALVQELILEVERQIQGWDKEHKPPMDNILEDVDKLSEVEKKALSVALKKMKK